MLFLAARAKKAKKDGMIELMLRDDGMARGLG
jgi:hypothetical protein